LNWNPDGTPNFGVPAADGVTVITQTLNPEDINGDKAVNMADVIIARYFNQLSSEINRKCDLNNDGVINMDDIIILAMKFNTVFG
jgi:hypothetical protein